MDFGIKDVSFIITFLVEVFVPVVLALIIARRFKVSWAIFFLGLGLFIASLIRIPLNNYVSGLLSSRLYPAYSVILVILFSSLTAGLFEEGVRVLGIGYIIKQKNYYKGLMYGIGHGGGGEAMLFVGLSTAANFIVYKFFPGILPSAVIEQYKNMLWYLPMVGALERIFAIAIQVFLSVLIMYAFLQKKYWVIAVAVVYHTVLDFVAVYINNTFGILYSEISVFIFAAAGAFFIFFLKPRKIQEQKNNPE